jgi:ABC-type nitrate/sulfonate/bicarbonate transport system substrate-binding protein
LGYRGLPEGKQGQENLDMGSTWTRRRFVASSAGAVAGAGLGLHRTDVLAQGADNTTVRLAYQPDLLGSIAMVALKEKIFESVGSKVEARRMVTGRQIRDASIAGHIDLGNYGGPTFVIGAAKGDLVAVAVFAHAGRSFHIIVPKDAPTKTVADLKGKKVGGILGGSVYPIFKNRIAPKFGLTDKDYEAINIDGPDQISALATKQVDAIAAVEPFVSIGEQQGIARSIVDFSPYDLSPIILCARPEFVSAHPGPMVTFLKGWIKAADILKNEPARAAKIVEQVYRDQGYTLGDGVIAKALGRFDIRVNFSPELQEYLHVTAQDQIRDKAITKAPDWSKVLRTEFLEKALAS